VPTVLAFEPDPKQAGALKLVVRDRVGAEFVHVESKDAALEAIRARVPDLILLTALLSPRDETEIADLLRELDGADYVQTLTIPLLDLGTARPAKRKKRGLLSALTGGAGGMRPGRLRGRDRELPAAGGTGQGGRGAGQADKEADPPQEEGRRRAISSGRAAGRVELVLVLGHRHARRGSGRGRAGGGSHRRAAAAARFNAAQWRRDFRLC
jgi:CheY-like chemotaxis protein